MPNGFELPVLAGQARERPGIGPSEAFPGTRNSILSSFNRRIPGPLQRGVRQLPFSALWHQYRTMFLASNKDQRLGRVDLPIHRASFRH